LKRVASILRLWLPVVAYAGLVFYLSSLSQVPGAGRLPDYLTHPIEYLFFTLLLLRALHGEEPGPVAGSTYLAGIALSVLYAISDELHQLHVPRRTASVKDVLSDTLGAVLAVGVAEVLQRFRLRHREPFVQVTLYTRSECHLCKRAREILARVSLELPVRWSEVDVDSDPVLAGALGEQVPVIMAGTTKISKLRPDEQAIRRRLRRIVEPAA
jgi:VanZ family protein/glutaredoxin